MGKKIYAAKLEALELAEAAKRRARVMLRALKTTRYDREGVPTRKEVALEGTALVAAWAAFCTFYELGGEDQDALMNAGRRVAEMILVDDPVVKPVAAEVDEDGAAVVEDEDAI